MLLPLDANAWLCLYTDQCTGETRQSKYELPRYTAKQWKEVRRIRRDLANAERVLHRQKQSAKECV